MVSRVSGGEPEEASRDLRIDIGARDETARVRREERRNKTVAGG